MQLQSRRGAWEQGQARVISQGHGRVHGVMKKYQGYLVDRWKGRSIQHC